MNPVLILILVQGQLTAQLWHATFAHDTHLSALVGPVPDWWPCCRHAGKPGAGSETGGSATGEPHSWRCPVSAETARDRGKTSWSATGEPHSWCLVSAETVRHMHARMHAHTRAHTHAHIHTHTTNKPDPHTNSWLTLSNSFLSGASLLEASVFVTWWSTSSALCCTRMSLHRTACSKVGTSASQW